MSTEVHHSCHTREGLARFLTDPALFTILLKRSHVFVGLGGGRLVERGQVGGQVLEFVL